ncbi:MAG TPA: efflux RND transporter periplasmic adaptor subunit [Terriglobales bacterium]|nr:efflux RND transporter periplasmic adaptor subunit [Terriglobales bacterium]
MKKVTLAIFVFLLVAGAFLAGSWYNQRTVAHHSQPSGRKVLYYVDPMHPAYKSDKPGIAPDCGMQLEPVYADAGTSRSGPDNGSSQPAGVVAVSPEKQQIMGVRVSAVEKASGSHTMRLLGRVTPDESKVYKLNAGVEGFIREVAGVTTGSQVKKDQLLATFSAPNASSVIQTYILNVGAEERFKKSADEGLPEGQSLGAANWNIQQRTQQLQSVGMSLLQMEEIKRTRQVPESIKILAPADGFVLARNVSPGLKFEKGAEWYRIADLSQVWIVADVFENEAQYLRPGVRARVTLPNQGKTFGARVSEVLPQFDAATRTLKVRLEADNVGYLLRPDMFVDVELPISYPATITVPVDAVLDSGLKKTVFVERGEGFFEPRQVETGWRFEDRVEIVKGLTAGERIVVGGNFLIGSESRLKEAAAGMYAPVKDPTCGMEVDQGKAEAAGKVSKYGAKTYYFCSDQCKRKFEANPESYLKKVAAPMAGHKHAPASHNASSSPDHGGNHG